MDVLDLILAALATFRLAYLISREDGPLDVFLAIRDWLDDRAMKNPNRFWVSSSKGIACPYCTGIYLALLTLLLMVFYPSSMTNLIIYTLAIAGLQAIIQKLFNDG